MGFFLLLLFCYSNGMKSFPEQLEMCQWCDTGFLSVFFLYFLSNERWHISWNVIIHICSSWRYFRLSLGPIGCSAFHLQLNPDLGFFCVCVFFLPLTRRSRCSLQLPTRSLRLGLILSVPSSELRHRSWRGSSLDALDLILQPNDCWLPCATTVGTHWSN